MNLKDHIRTIPDFPKPGIMFYDISPLLRNPLAWQTAMERLAKTVALWKADILVGIESRGFLTSAPLALKLGLGFIMARKPNKLPGPIIGLDYDLEYGSARLEIQADALTPGQRVVILDDLLATGGTVQAGIRLMRHVGANVVGVATIVDLAFLKGREHIDAPFASLICYDS